MCMRPLRLSQMLEHQNIHTGHADGSQPPRHTRTHLCESESDAVVGPSRACPSIPSTYHHDELSGDTPEHSDDDDSPSHYAGLEAGEGTARAQEKKPRGHSRGHNLATITESSSMRSTAGNGEGAPASSLGSCFVSGWFCTPSTPPDSPLQYCRPQTPLLPPVGSRPQPFRRRRRVELQPATDPP